MVLVGFTVGCGLRVGCLGVGWLRQSTAYYGFWQSAFEPLKFARSQASVGCYMNPNCNVKRRNESLCGMVKREQGSDREEKRLVV